MEQPSFELPSVESARGRLPATVTSFVGRETERAQLNARLHDPACRLLTVIGSGGAGKTRLSLEVAHALAAAPSANTRFADGVWFVPLAALAAGEALHATLATTVASALGIGLAGSEAPAQQIAQYLREKKLLLLFDNCENVAGAAGFVGELLRVAPGVVVLATSRERLQLQGEWLLPLEGLAIDDDPAAPSDSATLAGTSAVQLFVQRARMVAPGFELTAELAPVVAHICRLVAGLPLGIELAASWVSLLSCAEIAAEITHNLDFLAATGADVPARQHSLRAVFDSSWEQLAPAEQQALRRLAIFRGGFRRSAAAEIAEASLPQLAALMHKSLLRRANTPENEARYQLLEPLRLYAAEQLARANETPAVAQAHAHFYLRLLAHHTADLRGHRQQEALSAIESELAELRSAWQWAVANHAWDMLVAAADSVFHFYDMRSWFAEGATLFGAASEALAAHQTGSDAAFAWGTMLAREAWFVFYSGQQQEARTLLEHSVALLRAGGATAALVFPLNYLAAVHTYLGNYAQTAVLAQESLALARSASDLHGEAVACNVLGQAAYEQGAYAEAKTWSQTSFAIEQGIGNRWSAAFSLTNLGKAAYAVGAYREAQQLTEQSLAIRKTLNDNRGVAMSLARLGDTAVALRERAVAGARYAQSWELFRAAGDVWGAAAALINLGRLLAGDQRDAAAACVLAEALRLALQTSSIQQQRALFGVCAVLAERTGDRAWAATLAHAAAQAQNAPPPSREHAEQALAWLVTRSATEGITLEHALAAAQQPAEVQAAPQAKRPIDTLVALTAREREVLRLVAQGLSDAEVAERLVLSTRTVSTHLSSIYSKLQVKSRSAATRYALDNGLA